MCGIGRLSGSLVQWFNGSIVARDEILRVTSNSIREVVKDAVDILKVQQPRDKYTAFNIYRAKHMVYVLS